MGLPIRAQGCPRPLHGSDPRGDRGSARLALEGAMRENAAQRENPRDGFPRRARRYLPSVQAPIVLRMRVEHRVLVLVRGEFQIVLRNRSPVPTEEAVPVAAAPVAADQATLLS